MNLISVGKRNEIHTEETRYEEDQPEEIHEARKNINNNDTDNNGVVCRQVNELTEHCKEPESFFQTQIEAMDHYSLLQLEPREKLLKVKLTKEIEGSANRILGRYLVNVNIISEIADKVYAIGKAIVFKLVMKQPERNRTAKKDVNGENSREQKLKREVKQPRQWIARTNNDLFRRKIRRKATNKEKEI